MTSFEQRLEIGRAAESAIALWLRQRGNTVLPVYEKLFDDGKGPQVFTPDDSLVSPDLLIWNGEKVRWIEAKHKTAFTWHRISRQWVTGIDKRHYWDYLKVAEQGPFPVWLLFLHCGGHAKDSPTESPKGLFGNDLSILAACVNHTHSNWGKSGMVYWAIGSLKKIATLEEVLAATV